MIISAFPGTGKTYLYNEYPDFFGDSDSSKFSWLSDGIRNPDFAEDYANHIESNASKHLALFVSSHDEIRKELMKRGISFLLVYPNRVFKDDYMERYKRRGSPEGFLKLMDSKWDEMIDSCEAHTGPKLRLEFSHIYISHLFQDIVPKIICV